MSIHVIGYRQISRIEAHRVLAEGRRVQNENGPVLRRTRGDTNERLTRLGPSGNDP